jgi:hypothetical protein
MDYLVFGSGGELFNSLLRSEARFPVFVEEKGASGVGQSVEKSKYSGGDVGTSAIVRRRTPHGQLHNEGDCVEDCEDCVVCKLLK